VVLALLVWLEICHVKTRPATVTMTWSYDYGPDPACNETRTTNCVDHFEVKDITAGPVLLQRVDNPHQAYQAVNDITATFSLGPPYGVRTLAVAAVGRDGSGQAVASNLHAAEVQVMVVPHRPRWCVAWLR
jgi:hypothetical protein